MTERRCVMCGKWHEHEDPFCSKDCEKEYQECLDDWNHPGYGEKY
ncbi:hypothetical protein [Bacillus sp. MMSF_3328]|nr:hypothetical protein [Bacillus sp. MMSF_3328]